MKNIYILLTVLILINSCTQNNDKVLERVNIDFDWKFKLSDENNVNLEFDIENSENIDLPHDWSIDGVPSKENASGAFGGYYPGGIGWYQKDLEWNSTWENKQIFITFDGVYMNSEVWINDHLLGKRPNGYIGFTYNLTPYLKEEGNKISVRVDNSKQPSGRWYTGCGIYRHVWLDIKDEIHIPQSGTYAYFSEIKNESAKLHIETEVNNTGAHDRLLTVESILFNDENIQVDKIATEIKVESNKTSVVAQNMDIKNPNLWSSSNPYLYYIKTTVKEGNKLFESVRTSTGIRSLKFDAEKGFLLNGKNLKLKGVSMHHAAGALGSAVPEDVLERRIKLLKEMGCNAIRVAHTPFSPEFYDMCDRMGMLVMDEAFDGWDTVKAESDYGLYFEEWWKTDLIDFMKRDRNHPSVIMWSIGNEVRGRSEKVEKDIVNLTRKLDSTRPITIGASHDANIVDIAGFNGHGEFPNALEKVHEEHPTWPIVGTEVPHSWQTRGIYRTKTWWRSRDFPAPWAPEKLGIEPKEGTYFPIADLTEEEVFTGIDSNYLSSYDNATVRISARDQWKRTAKLDFFMGEFRWTGFDYLGENIWPNKGWHCGVLDLAGFKKDHYFFYQSVWDSKPMVHMLPHWTHPGKEGVEIPIVVYSNCEEVELFLNGKSLGVKRDTEKEFRLLWYVPYEAGILKAVARNNGEVIVSDENHTAGEPYAVQLISDKTELSADKTSVSHVIVKIVDKDGNFVPAASHSFTYEIKGPGKVLGVENGDMLDLSHGKAETKKVFNGLALIYIQSTNESGLIEVEVKSAGLKLDTIEIQALPMIKQVVSQ